MATFLFTTSSASALVLGLTPTGGSEVLWPVAGEPEELDATITTRQPLETGAASDSDIPVGLPAPATFSFLLDTVGFANDSGVANFDPFSMIFVEWDYGDPGSYYNRLKESSMRTGGFYDVDGTVTGPVYEPDPPTGTSVEFLGPDRNRGFGQFATHTYNPTEADFAGADFLEYTVTARIYRQQDATPILTRTLTLKVYNPAIYFGGSNTVLVSTQGDTSDPNDPAWQPSGDEGFNFNPATARRFNSFRSAMDNVKTTLTYARVLIRNGESHVYRISNNQSSLTLLQIATYGEGKEASFHLTKEQGGRFEASASGSFGGLQTFNFGVIGPFDASDPCCYWDEVGDSHDFGRYGGKSIALFNHYSAGCGSLYQSSAGATHRFIDNIEGHDYWDYGLEMTSAQGFVSVQGAYIHNPTTAFIGTRKWPGNPPMNASHAPLRINSAYKGPFNLQVFDFKSTGGWGGSTAQPALRNTKTTPLANTENYIEQVYINRGVLHPGNVTTGADFNNDLDDNQYERSAIPRRQLYEMCYLAGMNYLNPTGVPSININLPGAIVRSCVFNFPKNPRMIANRTINTDHPGTEVFLEPYYAGNLDYHPLNNEYGTQVYSNTFITRQPNSRLTPEEPVNLGFNEWAYVDVDNNLFMAEFGDGKITNTPNYLSEDSHKGNYWYAPGTGSDDWVDTTPRMDPYWNGFTFSEGYFVAETRIEADDPHLAVPTSNGTFGSGGDNTGRFSKWDFFGRLIPPSAPPIGASLEV